MSLETAIRKLRPALLAVLGGMGASHADTLVLPAAADGFIRASQSAAQTANTTNPLLLIGDTVTANDYLRGVLAFDLAVPELAGAAIHSARLDLTVSARDTSNGGSADAPQTILLHPLASSFDEAAVSWTRRDAADPWNTPGGDYGPPIASFSANPAAVGGGEIIGFTGAGIEDFVRVSVGGGLRLLVKLESEDAVRSVFRLASGESAAANPPRLVIDYTPAASPPPVVSPVTPLPGHRDCFISPRYKVTAGGRPVEVKAERFGFDVALFSLTDEGALVEIDVADDFASHTLKPARHGIAATRGGNKLSFPLGGPLRLVLEIPGRRPLALIVTPPEENPPSPDDPGVIYFGPGTTVAGVIRPASHQTVYLAPGALVRGRIEARDVSHVAIRGRGFLETEIYSNRADRTPGILFENTEHIRVEGIGLRSYQTYWQTLFLNTRDAEVSHLNIFGLGVNTDGVDIDGVRDFVVRDSFIRAEDDGLGWHSLDAAANGEPLTERALAEDLVIWNTGAGNGVRIGASMETQLWRDITLRRLDILQHAGAGIFSDFSDWAWMRDLRFENIAIERPASPIDFRIAKTIYSNSTGFLDERGHIERLVFRDVACNGGTIRLSGYDGAHRIDGVRFIGCSNAGVPLNSLQQLSLNEYVTDVAFGEELPPRGMPPPGTHEAEELESRTNGIPQHVEQDLEADGARVRILHASAPGDYLEHTLDAPAAGDYQLRLRVRTGPASGIARLSFNGADLGGETSFFSPAAAYQEIGFGQVTVAAPGPVTLRLTVTGRDSASAGHRLELDAIRLLTPLQAWRETHFLTTEDSGPAADAADPDGDGAANLIEFATGTPPLAPQPPDAALSPLGGAGVGFSFTRLDPAPLAYVVEASGDLAAWRVLAELSPGSGGWAGREEVGESPAGDGRRRVTITSPPDPGGRCFLRLRVASP